MWRMLLCLPVVVSCSLEELTAGPPVGADGGLGGSGSGGSSGAGGSESDSGIAGAGGSATECGGKDDGYCASITGEVEFCADFDQVPSIPGPFANKSENAGSVGREPTGGCNSSAAARMSLPASAPGCSYATLSHALPGPFKRARLFADLLLGEPGTGEKFLGDRVLSIQTEAAAGTDCRHFVNVRGDKTYLHTQRHQVFDDSVDFKSTVPLGKWTHVELIVDVVQDDKAQVTVLVDGVEALPPTLTEKCGAGSKMNAVVGLYCETEEKSMLADNVVIDLE